VLQVLQSFKTDAFTTTSASLVDVTGLTVNITPIATSSKILVMCHLAARNFTGAQVINLVRNTTNIGVSTAGATYNGTYSGFTQATGTDFGNSVFTLMFLDTPSTTSAITYRVRVSTTAGTFFINRLVTSGNDAGMTSSITVMEVAG
jgi:hypothetical protein